MPAVVEAAIIVSAGLVAFGFLMLLFSGKLARALRNDARSRDDATTALNSATKAFLNVDGIVARLNTLETLTGRMDRTMRRWVPEVDRVRHIDDYLTRIDGSRYTGQAEAWPQAAETAPSDVRPAPQYAEQEPVYDPPAELQHPSTPFDPRDARSEEAYRQSLIPEGARLDDLMLNDEADRLGIPWYPALTWRRYTDGVLALRYSALYRQYGLPLPGATETQTMPRITDGQDYDG